MIDGYEKLKNIGAQKIHERTHISKIHVQAIIHESFDDMSKIQFLGFLSILEREYDVTLDDLREKGLSYFSESGHETDTNDVFVTPKKKKNYSFIYMGFAILIFIVVAAYTLSSFSSSSDNSKSETIDNSAIESAQKNIETTKDVNISEVAVNTTIEEPKGVVKSFKIIPKRELWMGYIDLTIHKKYQKIFSDEFRLDPEKDWLLSLGHGQINIEIDGVIEEFKIKRTVRFLYKDGVLKRLTFAEFKSLNRGDVW